MKASTDLFELIKSLSKSEKRYFRMYSGLQQGDKEYLKVFEFIDKHDSYDEKELKLRFKNEKFIRHLPFTKKYLYNSIIKSLLAFNDESSIEQNLLQQVKKVKLLYNRSLFKQSAAALAKAKALAQRYEKDYILLELLRIEIRAKKKSRYGISADDPVFEEEKKINQKLQNLYAYSRLYVSAANLRLTQGFLRKENSYEHLEAILNNEYILDDKNVSVREMFDHLSSHVRLASLKGDMEEMLRYAKDVLHLIETRPEPFDDDNSLEMIQAYIDIFYPALKLKRFNEYDYYLEKLRSLTPKSPVDEVNIFMNICFSEIVRYLTTAEFAKGIGYISEVEKGLTNYKGKITRDDESALYYNITRIYIGAGEYEKALEYSNRLLSRPVTEIRHDLYCYAKIVNLIIHYELGNEELLGYLIRSVYKVLKRREKLYRFETLLLGFLRKLPSVNSNEEFIDTLVVFRNEMISLYEDRYEKNAFIYFDFIHWAESKIQNKSLREIITSLKL